MRILFKDYETGDLILKEVNSVGFGSVDCYTQHSAVTFNFSDGTGSIGIACSSSNEGNEIVEKVAIQGYIDLSVYEDYIID